MNRDRQAERRETVAGSVLVAFAIVVSVLLFAATAGQPFHLDNMDFPAVAKATSATGRPVYYAGEETPKHLGLYHPPLYIYLLAGWIRLFGFGEVQIRFFGYCCLLVQFWLALRIMGLLFGREEVRCWAPFILLGFLPHAFTLQTASIVDIDSTIYGPLLLAVVYFALSLSWNDGMWHDRKIELRDSAFLAVILAIAFWAKLTTALLTLLVLPLLFLPKLHWRKALAYSLAAGIGGVLVFAGSYWLYGWVMGLDIGYTYRFLLDSFLHRGASGHGSRVADYARNFGVMFPLLLTWTGALPVLATALAVAGGLFAAWRRKNVGFWHASVVAGIALVVTLYYCAQTMTFGHAPFKYVFAYWSILAVSPIIVARAWILGAPGFSRISLWSFAALYAAGLWTGGSILQDRMLYQSRVLAWEFAVLNVPVLGLAIALLLARFRKPLAGRLLAASVVLAGGMACGVAWYQAGVDYSTTYDYGQVGMREAAAFIRIMTRPGDTIISMKDVGHLARRRYLSNYGALYWDPHGVEVIADKMRSGSVALAVFTEDRGQDQLIVNPALKLEVERHSCLIFSVGNYRIYRPYASNPPIVAPCLK